MEFETTKYMSYTSYTELVMSIVREDAMVNDEV